MRILKNESHQPEENSKKGEPKTLEEQIEYETQLIKQVDSAIFQIATVGDMKNLFNQLQVNILKTHKISLQADIFILENMIKISDRLKRLENDYDDHVSKNHN